jgi:hypothetical protein
MNTTTEIAPFVDEQGVPFCALDCPQMTRRLRSDGEPSRSRPWFCKLVGHDTQLRVCRPMVARMHRDLVLLRLQVKQ